jgi:hypothetical protein
MFIVGISTRDRDESKGYMFCPVCNARKPAAQGATKTYFTFFFIPLFPVTSGVGYYRCEGCQKIFDPNVKVHYDFGDHANPELWECYNCRTQNPSSTERCLTCGANP